MKFETVRIYFLSEFLVCCHPKILLPWQHDVTTSLYLALHVLFYNSMRDLQVLMIHCKMFDLFRRTSKFKLQFLRQEQLSVACGTYGLW